MLPVIHLDLTTIIALHHTQTAFLFTLTMMSEYLHKLLAFKCLRQKYAVPPRARFNYERQLSILESNKLTINANGYIGIFGTSHGFRLKLQMSLISATN